MKNKSNILFLFSLLFIVFSISKVSSQTRISISGIVIDSITKQPLEYCNIVFKNIKDRTKVTGAITNEIGYFKIDIPLGYKYLMQFSFISYKTLTDTVNLYPDEGTLEDFESISELLKIDIGKIELVPNNKILETVNVKESAKTLGLDKQSVIITNELRKNTIATKEVLNKVDGVKYNQLTQEVKVDNNKKVKILIDGVEKNQDYILNLNPKRIKKIEILRNISGIYEIEGYNSIINIITYANYRGADLMLSEQYLNNFSINNSPHYLSNNSTINIDVTRDKLSFYLKTSGNYSKTSINSRTATNFTTTNDKIINGNDNTPNNHSKYQNFDILLGADYRINKKHLVGFELNIAGFPALNESENISIDTIIMYNDTSKIKNTINSSSKYYDLNTNLFYRYKVDSLSKLTSYINYSQTKTKYLQNINFEKDIDYNKSYSNLKYNLEYEKIFSSKYIFTGGTGYINNDYKSETKDGIQSNFNNHFNKFRLYAYLKVKINSTLGFLMGTSYEYYIAENSSTKAKYNSFQPKINLYKKLNTKNKITLEYNLKTVYPYLSDLNPQLSNTTPFVINVGNPNLDPFLYHNFSFLYQYSSNKFLEYFSLKPYYNYSDNSLGYKTLTNDSIIIYQNENFVKHEKYGIKTNLSFQIKEKLTFDIYLNIFKDWNKNLNTPVITDWTGSSQLTYTFSTKHYFGLMYQKDIVRNVTSLGYKKHGNNYIILYWMTLQLKGRLQLMIGYSLPIMKTQLNEDYEYTTMYEKTTYTDVSFMNNLFWFNLTFRLSKGKVHKIKKNIDYEYFDKSKENNLNIGL